MPRARKSNKILYRITGGFIIEPHKNGETAVEGLEFALKFCRKNFEERELKRITVEFVPIKRDDEDDADDQ